METHLGHPSSEEDFYLARGEDVEPYRPILQGDVFAGVEVPNVEVPHTMAMVIAHPCSMRMGGKLQPLVKAIPVIPYQYVPFDAWPTGHFRVCPLQNLVLDGCHYAARLDRVGMVKATDLAVVNRTALLTEKGVMLLQQRNFFNDSRTDIRLDTLKNACNDVLTEAELQEEWNERLAPLRIAQGVELQAALDAEADEFDSFLNTMQSDQRLRDLMKNDLTLPEVRRRVRQEIARRQVL